MVILMATVRACRRQVTALSQSFYGLHFWHSAYQKTLKSYCCDTVVLGWEKRQTLVWILDWYTCWIDQNISSYVRRMFIQSAGLSHKLQQGDRYSYPSDPCSLLITAQTASCNSAHSRYLFNNQTIIDTIHNHSIVDTLSYYCRYHIISDHTRPSSIPYHTLAYCSVLFCQYLFNIQPPTTDFTTSQPAKDKNMSDLDHKSL